MQVRFCLEGADEARLAEMARAAGLSVEETAQSIVAAVLDDDARAHAPASSAAPPSVKRRGSPRRPVEAAPVPPPPETPALATPQEVEPPHASASQVRAVKAFASVGHKAGYIARQCDLPLATVNMILNGKRHDPPGRFRPRRSTGEGAAMTIKVSDHALVRFLARAHGFEVEELRLSIAGDLARAVRAADGIGGGNYAVKLDGLTFIIKRDTVVTVLGPNMRGLALDLDNARGRAAP